MDVDMQPFLLSTASCNARQNSEFNGHSSDGYDAVCAFAGQKNQLALHHFEQDGMETSTKTPTDNWDSRRLPDRFML
jgi:hypothetical protein